MAKDPILDKLQADLRFEKRKIREINAKLEAQKTLTKDEATNWLQSLLNEANKTASALQKKILDHQKEAKN